MGMSAGPRGGIKNEINVTPLVDVVLVLLIIFMVVTPMMKRGKEVNLPQSHSTEEKKGTSDQDALVLSITADQKLYIESDELDVAGLQARLREELAKQPNRKILLKGDLALNYGRVREVMELARKAGAKGIGLGVEQIKEK